MSLKKARFVKLKSNINLMANFLSSPNKAIKLALFSRRTCQLRVILQGRSAF